MPTRSDKKHLYIELRSGSGSGHNRHRFVRRHSTSQTPTKKPDNKQHHHSNPMRLGLSFSIATSSEQPAHAPSTKKTRKRRATTTRATSDAETEKAPETCRRTDAVRVDHRGAPDVFGSWGWGCMRDWRAMGHEDEDVSVDVGERRRRRRGHHHHRRCQCRPLQQHVFYQPVTLFDTSQVQNNYYDYARGECRPECATYRDVKDKDDDVHYLLPRLDRLSLANGHDERASSPPPAYSDVCPRETDTPFVGHGAEFRHLAECQQVHDELDGFGRVQDWLLR
ncbi:hypothetical protein IWZ00DRAFT_494012 [Phyllosticta capitalensis]